MGKFTLSLFTFGSNLCWDSFFLVQGSFFWVKYVLGQFTLDQNTLGSFAIGSIFFGSNFCNLAFSWVKLPWTQMFWVKFPWTNVLWVNLPWTECLGHIFSAPTLLHRQRKKFVKSKPNVTENLWRQTQTTWILNERIHSYQNSNSFWVTFKEMKHDHELSNS